MENEDCCAEEVRSEEPRTGGPLQRWVSWLLGRAKKQHNLKIAKKIKACFDKSDLTTHRFSFNGGNNVKVKSGEDGFYEAKQVDKAIDKLNKLMDRLAN